MEDDRRDSTSTLAALLDPGAQQQEPLLDSLPLSKVLRRDLADTWRFRSRCVNLAAQDGFDPAERARTLRGDQGRRGLVLARAQCRSRKGNLESLDQMLAWAADAILFVDPLLSGTQLTALGMVPGPAVGRMLRDLEDEQLRGTIKKVAEAEAFVRKTIANQA